MSHLYQEIAEAVRRRIAAGEFGPGDRLPPVRDLAKQWQCTPGTVQRAYRLLAGQGLVSVHQGSGARVLDNPFSGSLAELEWAGLINLAEHYLLEALSAGHSPSRVESALSVAVSRWKTLQKQPAGVPAPTPDAGRLRFAGSHDLTIELLAQWLAEADSGMAMETEFVGSLGGLIALARGEADLTGVHLWDVQEDSYNLPFIQRILPGRRLALVTLVHRRLGLILPAGNPQEITDLGDLAGPNVRWVNRQPGSGTRIWLDEQLRRQGIAPEQMAGYADVEMTHMAVAQVVASGKATAGLGIEAAAQAYGLSFVALTEEPYQLVIPESVWDRPAVHALLMIVRSSRFQTSARDLGGYSTEKNGDVLWIQ